MKTLQGTGVALVTPFNKEGGVDVPALERLVHTQVENGIDYLVVLGTTAETPTLSTEEKELVKPFYTSTELYRYYGNANNKLWVIYTTSKFKNKSEMKAYPNLKAHLDKFIQVIKLIGFTESMKTKSPIKNEVHIEIFFILL